VPALCALAIVLCPGCRRRSETRLLLYCGAGIRPPVAEIVDVFSRRHGVKIECNYAGSEVLLSTIKLSGLGDLYMPGDEYYVEQAAKEGLVAASDTVCHFVPVILVRKGNPQNITSLADLKRPGVKVGLGDPEVCAIGRLVSRIFAKNGISEEEVNRNVRYRAMTVNDLGEKIKLEVLDAVVVWDAIAALFAEDGEVVPIPQDQNIVSTVAVGVLRSSAQPELAQQFVALLTSPEGKAIFRKHHYSVSLPE
jgi:molybdate transport system substrate-binding protein